METLWINDVFGCGSLFAADFNNCENDIASYYKDSKEELYEALGDCFSPYCDYTFTIRVFGMDDEDGIVEKEIREANSEDIFKFLKIRKEQNNG